VIYKPLDRHVSPPEPDQKIESIIKHAHALQTKISTMESERYDILDLIGQLRYFDLSLKEQVEDSYAEKINLAEDEFRQIKNRLNDLGYCV